MKIRRIVLFCLMLLLIVSLAACGDRDETSAKPTTAAPSVTTPPEGSTPPSTEGSSTPPSCDMYEITFVVDGVSTVLWVNEGETPAFEGTPRKPATKDSGWRFAGWDKTLAPATANAVYTAVFEAAPSYTITWSMMGTGVKTYWSEGELPVCPEDDPSYTTPEFSYAFTGWKQEIVAASKDVVYEAQYTRTRNSYTVTFKNGDTVLTSKVYEYGETPVYDGTLPSGFAQWNPLIREVEGDATYQVVLGAADAGGLYFNLSTASLLEALSYGLVDYDDGNGQKTGPFNAMTATYFLALQEHYNPGSTEIRDRVLAQLRSLISGGHEPDMDMGPQWSFAACAASIALAKETPTIWSCLTAEEIGKLDFIMQCFAVAAAFGTNDCNDYRTTLDIVASHGNFNKGWNPNYQFAIQVPIICAAQYFGGADAIDNILMSFDYDAYIAKCNSYNFSNIKNTFQIAGKTLMEEGGAATYQGSTYGSGLGVKQRYTFKGFRLDEPERFLLALFELNYSGGLVKSSMLDRAGKEVAYIVTGEPSPYEGYDGMMSELNGGDAGGVRSSASYSMADLNMGTIFLTFLMVVDEYDIEANLTQEMQNKIWVGNNDLLFKLREGYQNFSNGVSGEIFRFSSYGGQPLIAELWENQLMDKLITYVELSDYIPKYTMPDGSVSARPSDEATVTLLELDAGYVWFDGKHYFKPGTSYTFEKPGTVSFTAVAATGIENGAYHVADKSGTIKLPIGATGDSQDFYAPSSLLSGKVLMVVTLTSPNGKFPDNFVIQHKHINGPNPTSTILTGVNGTLYTPENVEVAKLGTDGVTLAIMYDTNGTEGYIFVLTGDVYRYVTAFAISNGERTLGRLGYIQARSKNNDTTVEHQLAYSAKYYFGLTHPIDKPVEYPITLDYGEGKESETLYYRAGKPFTLPTPDDASFVCWIDSDFNEVTTIGADIYGPITLMARSQEDDFVVIYRVNGETHEIKSETGMHALSADLLPAGYMWFDGEKYYNAGYEYTLSITAATTLTAVPGAGDNGAGLTSENYQGTLTLGANSEKDAQQGYITGADRRGKFLFEIVLSGTDGEIPLNFQIQYKHHDAPNPATMLIQCRDGVIYTKKDGDTDYTVPVAQMAASGVRLALAYDTENDDVFIYLYHADQDAWELISSFKGGNTEGTAGRLLYIYVPKSGNSAEQAWKLSYDVDFYTGLTAPVTAPALPAEAAGE